jgi:hypothetical protein
MAGGIELETAENGDAASENGDAASGGLGDAFNSIFLELKVRDPETIAALSAYPEGPARDDFAASALRIGVLALRQARGQLDANLIQHECERMLASLQRQLSEHGSQVQQRLTGSLAEYFDPQTGRFHDRVQRLVQRDGELEQVLRRQIGCGDDSEMSKTLAAHFGPQSQLMKILSPSESQGLLAALTETLNKQLGLQRDTVLKQFSLDNEDGALARMIKQLTDSQGRMTDKLQIKIDDVVKEFSLDEENSALSRLVQNVSKAQQTISSEFSLDNDASALCRLKRMLESTNEAIHGNLTLDDEASSLARLKRELLTILEAHTKSNQAFQQDVKVTLAAMMAKRAEADRSTRHGIEFEDQVTEVLRQLAQQAGDEATATGHETGLISRSKVGDCVICLGPDSAAPEAKIVVEAKEDRSYQLGKARAEIEIARQNRQAQVGLFIFSKKTAPSGLEPVARYGNDVFVVWDAEDSQSDLLLKVGLTLAKALCVRTARQSEAQSADFTAIDEAILEIAKRTEGFDKVKTWVETIANNSENILKHLATARKSLERQVEILQEKISDLKQTLQSPGGSS